jgi:organic hydroperoxide reductase OsmC/OhrA
VTTHHYRAECSWRASTSVGYDGFDRAHTVRCPPADVTLDLTSDPAFLGDPSRLNPEQLLLASAVSCQLLAFLAVAARARIDVLGYEDHAEADMHESETPMRITTIRLRPRITVATGPSTEKVERLVEVAHTECFIASSLSSEMDVRPTIVFT